MFFEALACYYNYDVKVGNTFGLHVKKTYYKSSLVLKNLLFEKKSVTIESCQCLLIPLHSKMIQILLVRRS